jgi:hypothetical protein
LRLLVRWNFAPGWIDESLNFAPSGIRISVRLFAKSQSSKLTILRMRIRVRAFESCSTSATDGLDRLSSTVLRTKRDVMHSGQMICADFVRSDLAFEEPIWGGGRPVLPQ